MKVWNVNVSLLVNAQNNEEAAEIVDSFLRKDGRNEDLDFNFMSHKVEANEFDCLAELRVIQHSQRESATIDTGFSDWWHHSGHLIDYGTDDTADLEKRRQLALAAWRWARVNNHPESTGDTKNV